MKDARLFLVGNKGSYINVAGMRKGMAMNGVNG
jgi:hypothetical protein